MMANPRAGQRVRIRYAARKRRFMPLPLHDKVGTVVIVGKGKPRNHGVEIDGELYVIPCGQLMKDPPPARGPAAGETDVSPSQQDSR